MNDDVSSSHLDYLQDDLIRSILCPFASVDYEGLESISLKAVAASSVLDGVNPDTVNEALATAQRARLIEWDDKRIGALRLTPLGVQKFHLVRKDFFDDDEKLRLREGLHDINFDQLSGSAAYQRVKNSCNGLGAWSQQPCPISGHWIARRLSNQQLFVSAGTLFPLPEYDEHGDPVIWYLVRKPS